MGSSPKSVVQRERLAAALRENLKRRKAKARAVAAAAAPDEAAGEAESGQSVAGTRPAAGSDPAEPD